MKALLCKEYGGPELLVMEDIASPDPTPGEVVVDVAYIGLNFHDTLIIANRHVVQPELPFSPGSEFAGTIIRVGRGVTALKVGDRVAGNGDFGAAREHVAVPADKLVRLPDDLPFAIAATLMVTYVTAVHALVQRAQLKQGETLAVLGASGGVGVAAVEIGRLLGAKVIACASSDERARFAVRHGAQEGVDYGANSLREELRRLTDGRGVDVVYDPVGGALSQPAIRSLAWQGRHLVVGFASGTIPKVALNLALVKGCSIVGVFVGDFMRRDRAQHLQNIQRIFDWARRGELRSSVQATYPFEQYAEALGVLARREAQGKVLLKVRQGEQ
jgi:NADPH2:quinone reductase